MKRWLMVAAIACIAIAGLFVSTIPAGSSAAQNCEDWGNATYDRVGIARELLYPPERQTQTSGSAQGDSQALYDLAQEQANSNPPDEAFNLSADLVEAFSTGSIALQGGQGSDPEAQIAFAKAIVYNADLRIAYFLDGC
jgi:hypothetical protein